MTRALETGQGQLQTLVGGNYQFRKNASFDFGLRENLPPARAWARRWDSRSTFDELLLNWIDIKHVNQTPEL